MTPTGPSRCAGTVLAAASVAVLVAGLLGAPSAYAQPGPPTKPTPSSDPGPGCDPDRRAVAHAAGGIALPRQPRDAPIPCMTIAGNAIEAATMGATDSGAVFFGSIQANPDGPRTIVASSVLARSVDRGESWENVVPGGLPLSPHGSLSSWMSVDPTTSRLWYATPAAPCGATVSWSDDDGETWGLNPNIGCPGQGAAALIEGPAPDGTDQPEGYPHVVYYCANGADRETSVLFCHKSLDGGRSWRWIGSTPDSIPPEEGCPPNDLRRTRTGEVAPDGILYFPTYSCDDDALGIAISDDQGASWTRQEALETEVQDLYPPALGIDTEGNLYIAWRGAGGLPHLTISTDRGESWSEPLMIAPPQVDHIRRLGVVVREPGHLLVSYLASTEEGGDYDAYMTESRNALEPEPLFWTVAVNDPATPVREADASETFGDRIQFLRGHIADDGTPWAGFHCFDTAMCPDQRLGIAARLHHPSEAGRRPETPRPVKPKEQRR